MCFDYTIGYLAYINILGNIYVKQVYSDYFYFIGKHRTGSNLTGSTITFLIILYNYVVSIIAILNCKKGIELKNIGNLN